MKKSIVIIIFSVLTASLFIPGGYGYWTDVLTIKGSIVVVPTPIPVPTQMLIPITNGAPVEVIPVLNGNDALPTENTPGTVEVELPIGTGNADSSMPSSGDQSVETVQQVQDDIIMVDAQEDRDQIPSGDSEKSQEQESKEPEVKVGIDEQQQSDSDDEKPEEDVAADNTSEL